jgi:acetolactate synthase-1/2/3 large subunit
MTTSGYQLLPVPKTKQCLVHVHACAEELGRVYHPDLPLNATPARLVQLLAQKGALGGKVEAGWCTRLRESYRAFSRADQVPSVVNMKAIVEHVRAHTDDDVAVCNGAGNYAIWVHRYFPYYQYGSQLAPTSGSMGYGLPAALAAASLKPTRQVIAFAGDGCFMMTCQELATAVQQGLKMIVLVVNNGMYGTIRMHQERRYPGRVSGTALQNPDFAAMARAFGALGECVTKTEEFPGAFARAQAYNGVALIEIQVDPDALTPGATLSQISQG